MKLYVFVCKNLTNIWAGIGARTWAVSAADKPVCERYWAEHFECEGNPSAQAYRLLSRIDLGPELASARGPLLEFHEGDNHPGSNDRWVNAKDKL